MAYSSGGYRGGYFAPPIQRRVGWWSVIPLWGLLTRTLLVLGLTVWALFAAEAYLTQPDRSTALSHTSLQTTLFDLGLLLDGGIDVLIKGVGHEAAYLQMETRAAVNGEVDALQTTLVNLQGNLRALVNEPIEALQTLERYGDTGYTYLKRAFGVAADAVERSDLFLRVHGTRALFAIGL